MPTPPLEALLSQITNTLRLRVHLVSFQAEGLLHVRSNSHGGRALTEYLQQAPPYLVLTDVTLGHSDAMTHAERHVPVLHLNTQHIVAFELLNGDEAVVTVASC
jgi:hypothetical protein